MTDPQNNAQDFIDNVWGKREAGIPVPEIDWSRAVSHQEVEFLLRQYPFLQLLSSDPLFAADVKPQFKTAKTNWIIHDYGMAMSSSPGKFLLGGFSEETEEEGGEGGGSSALNPGQGTIINQAFNTAQEMIEFAIAKGWPGIEIIDGTDIMKWAAWVTAKEHQYELTGFEPSEVDKARRARLKRELGVPGAEPGISPRI